MIKPGKTLYAGRCEGEWFIKQAVSPKQFTRIVIEEVKRRDGYVVPPGGRWRYAPDLWWDEAKKVWREMDGSIYGPHLPKGAR